MKLEKIQLLAGSCPTADKFNKKYKILFRFI